MSKIRHSLSGKKNKIRVNIFNKKITVSVPSAPVFTLSSSNETRIVNTVATGFTIISTGDAIDSFSINATPAGMNFNTTTGALTGTPSNVQSATSYTISATNAGGTTTRTFTLTVGIALPAFTLSSSSETRTVSTAATGFNINSTGGAIASFSISPSAPAGMSFNTSTGALSGTPVSVQGSTNYVITATNASGSTSQTFSLTVIVAAPAFNLSLTSESRTVGTEATGFTINSTGGTIASFNISPSAPAGMTFNYGTGQLSGTPTSVAGATTYTITASNSTGSTTRTFIFTVTAALSGGTVITNPFSGNWSGTNVGSSFQMIPQNAPSWAGVITGRRVSPPPQTVTVSGVTGVNAAAANGTYKMYYDGFGNYWFEDKNFTGTNYSQVSTWLPNATITAY